MAFQVVREPGTKTFRARMYRPSTATFQPICQHTQTYRKLGDLEFTRAYRGGVLSWPLRDQKNTLPPGHGSLKIAAIAAKPEADGCHVNDAGVRNHRINMKHFHLVCRIV